MMTQEFADEIIDGIRCSPKNSKNKSFAELQVQTEPYKVYHRGTQSKKYKFQNIQTDYLHQNETSNNIAFANANKQTEETKILSFLRRTEPVITKAIQMNINSKVFKHSNLGRLFNVNYITVRDTLVLNEAEEHKLSATGLSWSASGALLAISYGSLYHMDWCTHNGFAALWNVTSETLIPNTPKYKYVTNTCLMCIKFHPVVPSLLAGGTFTGDLVVWNLANSNDHQLANIGGIHGGHKDCINQICWISYNLEHDLRTSNSNNIILHTTIYRLLSSGSDGRIICWQIDLRYSGKVNCVKIFQIRNKDQGPLPISSHSSSLKNYTLLRSSLPESINNDKAVNITCLSLAKIDPEKFIVGTETGGILLCEINSVNWNETCKEFLNEHFQSPVKFSLSRQDGPIYSVDWSKFYPNLILVSGFSRCIQLFSVLQRSSLISIDPNEGSILVAEFSSYLPNIFICITENNRILVYDLNSNVETNSINKHLDEEKLHDFQPEVLYTLIPQIDNGIHSRVISGKLNEKDSKLVATGNTDGIVNVWDFGNLTNELSSIVKHIQ
ncbi:WD repeat-containing protein 34 [Schistosoma japonicum]|nr:WD repeat-containing protein 34 [Schistosoma japonicum]